MSTIEKNKPFKILNAFKNQNILTQIEVTKKENIREEDTEDKNSSPVKMVSKFTDKPRDQSKSQSFLICNKDIKKEKKILVELDQSIVDKLEDFLQLSDNNFDSDSDSSLKMDSSKKKKSRKISESDKLNLNYEEKVSNEFTKNPQDNSSNFTSQSDSNKNSTSKINSENNIANSHSITTSNLIDNPNELTISGDKKISNILPNLEENIRNANYFKEITLDISSFKSKVREEIPALFTNIISQIYNNCKTRKTNFSNYQKFLISILEFLKDDPSNFELSFKFVLNHLFTFIKDELDKYFLSFIFIREKFNTILIQNENSEKNLFGFEKFWSLYLKEGKQILTTIIKFIFIFKETAKIFEHIFKTIDEEFVKYANLDVKNFSINKICLEQIWAILYTDNFYLSILTLTKFDIVLHFSFYQKYINEFEEDIKRIPKFLQNLKKFISLENQNFLKNLKYEFDLDVIKERFVSQKSQLNVNKKNNLQNKRNIDELYEYIISEDVNKSEKYSTNSADTNFHLNKKKKHKKKKKNKKCELDINSNHNNINGNYIEANNEFTQDKNIDIEVESFKKLISCEAINAKEVNKIKPQLKGEWMNKINK